MQLRESVKEYNVFCLDYEQLAKVPYPGIPGNDNPTLTQRFEYVIDIVGSKAARYLVALYEHNVISTPSQVHLIGGSLGGQVVNHTYLVMADLEKHKNKNIDSLKLGWCNWSKNSGNS